MFPSPSGAPPPCSAGRPSNGRISEDHDTLDSRHHLGADVVGAGGAVDVQTGIARVPDGFVQS
jgi:hypothetical protein